MDENLDSSQLVEHASASLSDVTDKLAGWMDQAITMLPNLVVAVLVVLVFATLARIVSRMARGGLHRTAHNEQIAGIASQGVRVAILVAGVFVALGVMGLDKTVSSLLAGVGILGLAVGFAFQDMLANLMSGILLAFRRPFERGEIIETSDVMGTIEETNLTATLVRTFQGQLVWIPNKDMLDNVLTNYSRTGERRIDIAVGVAYGDDLDLAEETVRKALAELPFKHPQKDSDVFFTGFGGSSIDMRAQVWIDLSDATVSYPKAQSDAIKAIKSAIDAAGLTIPFPIRTLDFGVVGGEPMREHLRVLQGQAARHTDRDNAPDADAGEKTGVHARQG